MFNPGCCPEVTNILERAAALAPEGVFCEFGVGVTKLKAIRAATTGRVVAFDWFQGLPEHWRKGYDAGKFAQPIPVVPSVDFVVGLFADTLPMQSFPVAYAYVDCDLYSSTKTVLAWLKLHAVPGCVVVFDEFYGYSGCEAHEQRALEESGLKYEFLFRSEADGEKVAIRILAT